MNIGTLRQTNDARAPAKATQQVLQLLYPVCELHVEVVA
jgi:hypothetical protein